MNEVVNLLTQYFPVVAGVCAEIMFFIFLILNVSDDFDKISSFIKKIFDLHKHCDTLIYSNKRKKYNKTLYQNDFLEWQKKVLNIIYTELIKQKMKSIIKNMNKKVLFLI